MKIITSLFASLVALGAVAACSGSSSNGPSAGTPEPDPNGDATVREALSFKSPCTGTTCGSVPESSKSVKPLCAPTNEGCGWTEPDPNGSVSYRQCPASECGAEPDASVCPQGTTFKGNTCGSENEAACKWTTACAPPRSTTPCPNEEDCGPMPAIGVICKDGSSGELACMKSGAKCSWQPTCE